MSLGDLLTENAVFAGLKASSKKQLLQRASHEAAALAGVAEADVFKALLDRERLGSTGVGSGVAIPHAKLPDIKAIYGLFLQLSEPVAFDSVDDRPVDLVFLLLAPEDAGAHHLKTLARVSRLLRDDGMRRRLRGAKSAEALFALLAHNQADAA